MVTVIYRRKAFAGGNGININVWHDMWMDEPPFIEKIAWEVRQNISEDTTISYFIDNDKPWKREKLQSYLPSHIMQKIVAIPIPKTEVSDKIIWKNSLMMVSLL